MTRPARSPREEAARLRRVLLQIRNRAIRHRKPDNLSPEKMFDDLIWIKGKINEMLTHRE